MHHLDSTSNDDHARNQEERIRMLESELAETKAKLNALRDTTNEQHDQTSGTSTDGGGEAETSSSEEGKKTSSKKRAPHLTVQEKKKIRKKNRGCVERTKNREDSRFETWFKETSKNFRKEWEEGIMIEQAKKESLIEYIRKTIPSIKQFVTMKNCSETRMNDILNLLDESELITYEELIDSILLCNNPIKDGKRKTENTPQYCEICKKASKTHIPLADHNCPYCAQCFHVFWKKRCLLRGNCECTCEICEEESHATEDCPYCALCIERGEGRLHRDNCNCDKKPAARNE